MDGGKPASKSASMADLVERAIEAYEAHGELGLAKYLESQPLHGPSIKSKFEALRHSGLLEAGPARDAAQPHRLGHYQLLQKIGEGGMGVVYLAEHVTLKRRVALKVIRPEHLLFEVSRERFKREIAAVARLQHPGIVPIHAVGEERGTPFFAMEYVEGCSVAEVISRLKDRDPADLAGSDAARAIVEHVKSHGGVDPGASSGYIFEGSWVETCCRLLRQAADALEHAHRKGVVHRDVKPNNLMLSVSGHVMLLDFGLAQADGTDPLTKSGVELGSLPYLAPEQVDRERGTVGVATDIYGLGVTLYEMLALRMPFEDASAEGLRRKILDARPVPLRNRNRSVSFELETICQTAMEPDPARRYATAGDFARDLDNVLMHRPVEARRTGWWVQMKRWCKRRPALATALALSTVLLVGGPLLYGWQQHESLVRMEALHRNTDGLRLAALSASHLVKDPPLAVVLAREAHDRAPGLLARNALYAAYAAHGEVLNVAGPVTAALARFSRDGRYVLSAFADGMLRCTEVETTREVFRVQAHETRVASMDVSADGNSVVTASNDGAIAVRSIQSGRLVRQIREKSESTPGMLAGAALSPDGALVLAWYRTGRCVVRTLSDGKILHAFQAHSREIEGAEWSRDGSMFLTRGLDRSANVWKTADFSMVHSFPAKEKFASAHIAPNGKWILTTETSEQARLWSLATGERVHGLMEGGEPMSLPDMAAFSPDSSTVAIVGRDHDTRIYDVATGALLRRLRGHDRLLRDVVFSPDGKRIATTGDDKTVRVWGVATGENLVTLGGHKTTVRHLSFSEDGEKLISVGQDVRVHRTRRLSAFSPLREHGSKMTRCYFAEAGRYITTTSHDGYARIFEFNGAAQLISCGPIPVATTCADIHTATGRIAVGGWDEAVRVFDSEGRFVHLLPIPGSKVLTARISPDGRYLLTTNVSRTPTLWRIHDGSLVRVLDGHADTVYEGTFSPDSSHIATGDRSGVVKIFEVESGECVQTLTLKCRRVTGVRFDATGDRLAVVGSEEGGGYWEWRTGRLIMPLNGQRDFLWTVNISRDGRWIATGGADRIVRLYNVDRGDLECALEGHDDLISDITFLPGDKEVASLAARDGVRIWPVNIVEDPRPVPRRSLSIEERFESGLGSSEVYVAASEWIARRRPEVPLLIDVVAALEADQSLDPRVKAAAQELLANLEDSPRELTNLAWRYVARDGESQAALRLAAARADAAVAAAPDSSDFVRCAGVAAYRLGEYARAADMLARPELVDYCDMVEEPPVTLAFLALSLAKLQRIEEARAAYDDLATRIAGLKNPSDYLLGLVSEAKNAVE